MDGNARLQPPHHDVRGQPQDSSRELQTLLTLNEASVCHGNGRREVTGEPRESVDPPRIRHPEETRSSEQEFATEDGFLLYHSCLSVRPLDVTTAVCGHRTSRS